MTFSLGSPSFAHGDEIPRRHTCEGQDLSPRLEWSGAPEGTRAFALIVEDPDAPDPLAPRTIWSHWVLYDLPQSASALDEGVRELPAGTREGVNDWKRSGYGGPCPPIGRHRYFHRLFALERALGDLHRPTRLVLLDALQGHVLAQAELIGTYQKHQP